MDGTTIIIICAVGLVALLAYLVFRFGTYRKKIRPVEDLSEDIGRIESVNRNDPKVKRPSIGTPIIPKDQLLVVLHRNSERSWKKAVSDRLRKGARGVIVSVSDPSKLRNHYRGNVRFIWLERSTAHDLKEDSVIVNPTNLSMILREVETMMEAEGIVVITDLEDILGANDVSRVIRFLRMLDDSSARNGFSSLVPASYRAIPQRVRVQLTQSFETVVI